MNTARCKLRNRASTCLGIGLSVPFKILLNGVRSDCAPQQRLVMNCCHADQCTYGHLSLMKTWHNVILGSQTGFGGERDGSTCMVSWSLSACWIVEADKGMEIAETSSPLQRHRTLLTRYCTNVHCTPERIMWCILTSRCVRHPEDHSFVGTYSAHLCLPGK